jgi:cytochrome c6
MMKKVIVLLAILAVAMMLTSSAWADDAAATYKAKCAMCHAADGNGTPMGVKMGVTPFKSSKSTDADMIKITKEGKAKMPAYKTLTDQQIGDLVKYIRTLK